MNTEMMDMNKIDIIKPTQRKACEQFGLTCSYCRQYAPHPFPVHSDWSGKDWDGEKAKAKEQKSLINCEASTQRMNKEQTMDVGEVPFHKLNLGHNKQKEKEPLEVTQSLVPQPSDPVNIEVTAKDATEEGQMDMEIRLQKEAEKFEIYERIYVGQLSKEENSDTEMEDLAYSYFG